MISKSLGTCLILSSITLFSAGCSNIPKAEDVKVDGYEAIQGKAPLAGGVGIAPVTLALQDTGIADFNPTTFVDVRKVQKEIYQQASQSKLFIKTSLLQKEEDATEDTSVDNIAWQQGADLILETTIRKIRPRLQKRDWSWWVNVPNWLFWMVPAWFVAAEHYELEIEADFRLRLIDQSEPLYRTTISSSISGQFDTLDAEMLRWLGIAMLFTPGLNNGEDWAHIAETLFPAALVDLSQKLVVNVEKEFRPFTKTKAYDQAKKRTLALVVGVGNFKDTKTFTSRPESVKGAKKVAEAIQSRYGSRYIKTLYDAQATAKTLQNAIEKHLAARAREGDTIIVFISTHTIADSATPLLALYDSTSDTRDRSSLSMGRIAQLLAKVPGNKALFLEADYPGVPKEKDLESVFNPLINKKITVMSATKPGQPQVPTGFDMGLFAYHMSRALSGKGDKDKNGELGFGEIEEYVLTRVESDAGFRGTGQEPFSKILDSQTP